MTMFKRTRPHKRTGLAAPRPSKATGAMRKHMSPAFTSPESAAKRPGSKTKRVDATKAFDDLLKQRKKILAVQKRLCAALQKMLAKNEEKLQVFYRDCAAQLKTIDGRCLEDSGDESEDGVALLSGWTEDELNNEVLNEEVDSD